MPCFLKMDPKGSRYREKRVGARTDPRGTPQVSLPKEAVKFPILNEKVLFVRKDLNKFIDIV